MTQMTMNLNGGSTRERDMAIAKIAVEIAEQARREREEPDPIRAQFLCDHIQVSVEIELVKDEAIMANPEWLELAERAHQALEELYQSIVNRHR